MAHPSTLDRSLEMDAPFAIGESSVRWIVDLARRFPLYAELLDHLETNIPGVFAAGDVRHGSVKRFASAVGEGAMAVTFVHRYLMRG